MNITVTQNNSNIEWVTSNIIKKMYQLAIDPNNTVSYSGYLKSNSGYASHVQYLNNTFGPGLRIEATKEYLEFEDDAAAQVCATYFGDGVGCTISDLANADFRTTVNSVDFGTAFRNAGVVKFNEFKYCTGVTDTSVSNTFPFRNNETLDEFTLPTSCKTISGYTFSDHQQKGCIAPKINGMENITYIQNFGCWNWGLKQADSNVVAARLFQIDWKNINGIWSSFYATNNCFKGDVILPKYPTDSWASNNDFSLFTDGRGQYITKIVFPETFTCNNLGATQTNSCNVFIFLTQTPANGQINMWRNQNWGVGNDRHLYVPRTLYNSLDMSATASGGTVTYSSVLKINYGCVPEPLDNYANISDDNKDELVSYGCTATGSTGNWTIKAPGEA